MTFASRDLTVPRRITCYASLAIARGVAHFEHGEDRNPLAGGDNFVSIGTCQACGRLAQSGTVTVYEE